MILSHAKVVLHGAWLIAVVTSLGQAETTLQPPTFLGAWPDVAAGSLKSLCLSGTNVLAAIDGGGLAIYDANPTNGLLKRGGITPSAEGWSATWDVKAQGQYAYLAQVSQGVVVVDISEPSNPCQVARCQTPFPVVQLAVESANAFVVLDARTEYKIGVLDIQDPRHPAFLATLDLPSLGYGGALQVAGGLLCCCLSNTALQIVNVKDPLSPVILSSCDLGARINAGAMAISPSYKYLYVGTVANGVLVIDISDARSPRVIATRDGNDIRALYVTDDRLYVGYDVWKFALDVLDIQNPRQPQLLGSYSGQRIGAFNHIQIAGNIAYVSKVLARGVDSGTYVEVLDVSEPSKIASLATSAKTGEDAQMVRMRGNLAYVANNGCLQVLDTTDPKRPFALGKMALDGTATDIALTNDVAYVVSLNGWLYVASLADPAHPVEELRMALAGHPYSLSLSGQHLFINNWNPQGYSMQVLDVTDIKSPREVAINEGWFGTVQGNLAFFTDPTPAFRICDVSDPTHPVELGSLPDLQGKVKVFGTKAFIFGEGCQGTVRLIDVSDPQNPRQVGFPILAGDVHDVDFRGACLYLALGEFNGGGLGVWDFSEPVVPRKVTKYPTGGYAWGVTATAELVALADGSRVCFYRIHAPGTLPPMRISAPTVAGVVLTFPTTTQTSYSIQATTDFLKWIEIGSVMGTGADATFIDEQVATHAVRFYRAHGL